MPYVRIFFRTWKKSSPRTTSKNIFLPTGIRHLTAHFARDMRQSCWATRVSPKTSFNKHENRTFQQRHLKHVSKSHVLLETSHESTFFACLLEDFEAGPLVSFFPWAKARIFSSPPRGAICKNIFRDTEETKNIASPRGFATGPRVPLETSATVARQRASSRRHPFENLEAKRFS